MASNISNSNADPPSLPRHQFPTACPTLKAAYQRSRPSTALHSCLHQIRMNCPESHTHKPKHRHHPTPMINIKDHPRAAQRPSPRSKMLFNVAAKCSMASNAPNDAFFKLGDAI